MIETNKAFDEGPTIEAKQHFAFVYKLSLIFCKNVLNIFALKPLYGM